MSEPIRLGLFVDRLAPGGTQRQFLELLRGLNRRRFSPHVACFHSAGAWFDRPRELDVPVTTFPIRGFARPDTLLAIAAFRSWCRTNRLAIVHTWDLYSNIFGLPGAALAGVPVRLGSRRGLNPDRTAGQRRLQRLAYLAAHRIVANSEAAARQLELEGVARSQIAVVYNGIDLRAFDPHTYRPKMRRVAMAAGLRAVKGIDILIAAAARIVPRVPDVRFVIIGDGPQRATALGQARELGVADRFEFLGHRDDVAVLLSQADLFVLPSRSEAFPNAVLEAMAGGLPVVATRVGGIVELVDDGRTGMLVPPEDPDALARALLDLMSDPARAADLGRAARLEVEHRYSLGSMVALFEELYTGEVERRAGNRRPARAAHEGRACLGRRAPEPLGSPPEMSGCGSGETTDN